jgi:hypothetical protein
MKGPALRTKKLSTLGLRLAALVAGLGLFTVARSGAPAAKGSLTALEIENSELRMTLEKFQEEKTQLSEALADSQKTVVDMRKNLTRTTAEREVFQRQAGELKLRIEALGLESGGNNNTAKLEQRLLTLISDLRVMADEKKQLSEAIIRLSEAASLYAKTAKEANPESRLTLETEIRNANMALGLNSPTAVEANPLPATISDGGVISVKEDLALIVINVGSSHGVKIGMPFQVIRGSKIVGSARVVDVRQNIAGAFIQSLVSEKDRIKVGDHVKVDAQQPAPILPN